MTASIQSQAMAQDQQRGTQQIAASPYAQQSIIKTPNWGLKTAIDVFLHNLSLGLFFAATAGALLTPARFGALTVVAYPLALLLLVVDLLVLISDLGDPRRFHHMLRVFKLSSPMSLGTWALSGYGILLGIAAAMAILHWPWFAGLQTIGWLAALIDWTGRIAAGVAIIPAVGAILYKGVLFSVSSQPGWRAARWFPAYISNSAILLGCSVLLLLAAVAGAAAAATSLRVAMLALLVFDVIFFWLVYRAVAPVFQRRYGPNQKLFFWLILVAGGWIVPFLLLLPGNYLALIPPLLILATALMMRLAFVLMPQTQPLPVSNSPSKETHP